MSLGFKRLNCPQMYANGTDILLWIVSRIYFVSWQILPSQDDHLGDRKVSGITYFLSKGHTFKISLVWWRFLIYWYESVEKWWKLHNEELNDLYSSPIIVPVMKSRRIRWTGHVGRMRRKRGVYRVLVGKPEGKRPLGRSRRRWEDNIKMDPQEVGCGCVD